MPDPAKPTDVDLSYPALSSRARTINLHGMPYIDGAGRNCIELNYKGSDPRILCALKISILANYYYVETENGAFLVSSPPHDSVKLDAVVRPTQEQRK